MKETNKEVNTSHNYERRCLCHRLEVRHAEGQPLVIRGLAAPYDRFSEDLGFFKEIIRRDAFKDSIEGNQDVLGLYGHDLYQVLSRRSAGSLKLIDGDEGLSVEMTLPDTTLANDVRVGIEAGNLNGLSVGMQVQSDRWGMEDEQEVREVLKANLVEISVTPIPAYTDTNLATRSRDTFLAERRSISLRQMNRRLNLLKLKHTNI